MPPRKGYRHGQRTDSRAAIIALLRALPALPTLLHRAALKETGWVSTVTVKPHRWFWHADGAEGVAD